MIVEIGPKRMPKVINSKNSKLSLKQMNQLASIANDPSFDFFVPSLEHWLNMPEQGPIMALYYTRSGELRGHKITRC